MRIDKNNKVVERRKKRKFIPVIYFMAEMLVVWLGLVVLHKSFDFRDWSLWGFVGWSLVFTYSFWKMVHVYERQKSYKE